MDIREKESLRSVGLKFQNVRIKQHYERRKGLIIGSDNEN